MDVMFAEKDRDFDGKLSFEEFAGQQTKLEKAFKAMDKDGDGYITKVSEQVTESPDFLGTKGPTVYVQYVNKCKNMQKKTTPCLIPFFSEQTFVASRLKKNEFGFILEPSGSTGGCGERGRRGEELGLQQDWGKRGDAQ